MSFNLGSAEGHISMDYDGTGASRAKSDMDDLQSKSARGEAALSGAAGAMGKAGLVIAGGLALAVNSAADFEQRLSAIEAVSGATGKEMDAISAKALQLGKDTAFSATESAQAMEELIKAGLTVDEVLNGAADATVNLAAAGEIDLPQAATIASNAMNQFNLAAKDMPHVADLIAGAANASAIDVSDFGLSMQQAGATANLVGLSFDDLAAAIAIMGNAGIRGSDAGTSLKTMLSNLQPTTEKQIGLMTDLGIITKDGSNRFFDAAGNIKSMSDIAGVLSNSLKGMSKQQKAAALETIFGSDAIRAAAIIANEGSKGFDKMADSMGKVTAQEVAEKRLDNMRGSLEQLKGSLETAGIMIGQVFLPGVRAAVDQLNEWLGVFLELSPETQRWVGIIAAATAGVLLLAAGVIKAGLAITNFARGLSAVSALLAANPVILVAAALIALGVAFVIAYQRSQEFKDFIDSQVFPIFEPLKALVMSLVDAIVQNWPKILATAKQVWGEIGPTVMQALKVVVGLISINLALMVAQIKIALALIQMIWDKWGDEIILIVKTLWKILGPMIRAGLRTIQGIIDLVMGILTGDWSRAWNGIKNILGGAVDSMKAQVKGAMEALKLIMKLAFSALVNIVTSGGSLIVSAVKAIPGKIQALVGLFVAAGKAIINGLVDGFKSATGFAGDVASGIWDVLRGMINSAIDSINASLEFSIDTPGPGSVGVNPPDIPRLARGAVITKPTMAIVGEGRDNEWVMPEGRLPEFFAAWLKEQGIDATLNGDRGRDGKGHTIVINNPEPERGSDSLVLTLNQLTVAGVL